MAVFNSSYRGVQFAGKLFGFARPYTNMATLKNNINFNTKHLKKGDPLPPHTGKPRVYNMRFCPYAQRTILAMNAKGIDYEVVNIDLVDKPEWLTTKSTFGKVPSVEITEDEVIYESLVTVEYLDEIYPQRPLLPKDPVKKAFDKIIVESTGPIQKIFFKTVKSPETLNEDNITAYFKALDFIQDQLKNRGSKFLDGSEPGFADYMIWPWFERNMMLDLDERLTMKADKYALLLEYLDNMMKDPAVSQYLYPKTVLIKFMEAYKNGDKPDYDILIK